MALPITGAATQGAAVTPVVVAMALPVVALASLNDITHPINDSRESGKGLGGGMVMSDNAGVQIAVVAAGTAVGDLWLAAGMVGTTIARTVATPV